jgi:methionyl-tRNA formyltransferase
VGRGLRLQPSPVKRFSLEHNLPLFQPSTLKASDAVSRVVAMNADALVVAAYGLILPAALLACARLGALNIHASLLPRWRGAAPIQRALLAGDSETGICIMRVDEGLDTGPVLAQRHVPIDPTDDAGSLHDKLATLGAEMMNRVLSSLESGGVHAEPQPEAGVTYARKIEKEDLLLRWSRPAEELERVVRAFRPSPGAATTLNGEPLKVWRAEIAPGAGEPGRLLQIQSDAIVVACGRGALRLMEVQRSGGKRMSVGDFLRGRALAAGARFA